jgi:predicted dienelactone hydrolase
MVRWPITSHGAVAPGRHALVVFAHGFAVDASTYTALLDDLARDGLIVAAPELPGETSALPGRPNENDLVREPCDLEFVAASLKREPPRVLAAALAAAPVSFAGHSDGATAAAAAGYSAHRCPGPRASAVVALSSSDVAIARTGHKAPPLLAVTGTDDQVNPWWNTAQLWRDVPSPAWLLTVDAGTHLGTFTTDPALTRIGAIISAFIFSRTIGPHTATEVAGYRRFHLYRR